jgi:hypothetical protein
MGCGRTAVLAGGGSGSVGDSGSPTLSEQDELKEYHTRREYAWPTIESIAEFPVHFGIVDAIISADGQFGVIASAGPRKTDTIIAGANIIAVDTVGAQKMGLDPKGKGIGRFLPLAIERFGEPQSITVIGDESCYQPWTNVSPLMVKVPRQNQPRYQRGIDVVDGLEHAGPGARPSGGRQRLSVGRQGLAHPRGHGLGVGV